jgi:hypothetical protein
MVNSISARGVLLRSAGHALLRRPAAGKGRVGRRIHSPRWRRATATVKMLQMVAICSPHISIRGLQEG